MPGSSLEQVMAAVNQNAARVQSLQTNNATITVPGMPGIPLLRGNIAVERPNRVRLQASTALTGPEVDLGSNDELFWFWVRRNNPPALYFSRHDQYAGSAAQQVLPIDPQWLLDALGLAQFSASDQHEGPLPHGNGTLEIRSVVQSRAGTLTKSTVIDAKRAWVLEQHIYNSSGTLLASAIARSHRYYPEWGASLPQVLEIRLPAAQLALSMDLGTVYVNQLANNPTLWSMPVLSGYPQVDLGSAPPGAVPAVGSVSNRGQSSYAAPKVVGSGARATPDVAPASVYQAIPQPTPGPAFVAPPSPVLQPITEQLPAGGIPATNALVR